MMKKRDSLVTELIGDCQCALRSDYRMLCQTEAELLKMVQMIQAQKKYIAQFLEEGVDQTPVMKLRQMSDDEWNQKAYQNWLERHATAE